MLSLVFKDMMWVLCLRKRAKTVQKKNTTQLKYINQNDFFIVTLIYRIMKITPQKRVLPW